MLVFINIYLYITYISVIEIPACESAPCLNGGSCTNTDTGFTCTCAEGWRGNTCEESKACIFIYKHKHVTL